MKDRREFVKALVIGGGVAAASRGMGAFVGQRRESAHGSRSLPAPIANGYSPEILSNSRRSYHSFQVGSLPDQVLSNVLFATACAPVIGSYRTIYVALADNVYEYDAGTHSLVLHEPGDQRSQSSSVFEVAIAAELAEDAGASLHLGQLACHAFWASCCPKESCSANAASDWNPVGTIQMGTCYGLPPSIDSLTDTLVALSSDGSLPDPSTNGATVFEQVVASLSTSTELDGPALPLDWISQIAWSSYGCTDHSSSNGRAGLTVASAMANYYLSGRVYVVREEGVGIYHCRNGGPTTRDHRLEPLIPEDRRCALVSAAAGVPASAPAYFVFAAYEDSRWAQVEAGFCGAGALLQATAVGLSGSLNAGFDTSEKAAIRSALGMSSGDYPLLVFSVGEGHGIFADGFESGDMTRWSGSAP
jgi:hypothetical protein